MVMNDKGQAALVGLMIGVIIMFLGFAFINPMKDVITEVRAADQLDCGNSSISDGTKATCLAVDLYLPYFIVVIFGVGGAYITAKYIG